MKFPRRWQRGSFHGNVEASAEVSTASTASMEASMEGVEASMEAMEASMEAMEASVKASARFYEKNNSAPDPSSSIVTVQKSCAIYTKINDSYSTSKDLPSFEKIKWIRYIMETPWARVLPGKVLPIVHTVNPDREWA